MGMYILFSKIIFPLDFMKLESALLRIYFQAMKFRLVNYEFMLNFELQCMRSEEQEYSCSCFNAEIKGEIFFVQYTGIFSYSFFVCRQMKNKYNANKRAMP